MTNQSRHPLADAYAAWALLRGVTVADVQRASGLSRHTIESVRDGGRRRPTRETLRRLAIGLATDPGPGRYHERIMKESQRDLLLAAGYGDPSAEEARSLLDLALYYRFRSPARAHAWAALMERYGEASTDQVQALADGLVTDDITSG